MFKASANTIMGSDYNKEEELREPIYFSLITNFKPRIKMIIKEGYTLEKIIQVV